MRGSLIFFSENNIVIIASYHMKLRQNDSFSNILPKSHAPVDITLNACSVFQVIVNLILPNVQQLNIKCQHFLVFFNHIFTTSPASIPYVILMTMTCHRLFVATTPRLPVHILNHQQLLCIKKPLN